MREGQRNGSLDAVAELWLDLDAGFRVEGLGGLGALGSGFGVWGTIRVSFFFGVCVCVCVRVRPYLWFAGFLLGDLI